MEWYWIVLIIVAALVVALFSFLLVIYFMCFYNVQKNKPSSREPLSGKEYEPYDEEMRRLIKNAQSIPCEDAWIKSFDNKKLHARVYIKDLNRPFVILAHGYQGDSLRDFAGGLCFYLDQNFNAILIDQRAHGLSDGKTITFGVKERKDLISWVNYTIDTYGKDIRILLTGISMGGATVLMALDQKLPPNVKCIISDCPFSSPLGVILKVIKGMRLPANLCKPFVKMSARLMAHFNIEESPALETIKGADRPVLIVHGTADNYVPCYMSDELKEINPKIQLLKVDGAPHGLSFIVDNPKYTKVATEFLEANLFNN